MALNQDTEDPELEGGKIDHSTAGAQTLWRGLKSRGNADAVAGETLALCLASHHSGLIDCVTPSGADNLSRRMSKADSDSHHDEAWASAERLVRDLNEVHLTDPDLVGGLRGIITRMCQIDSSETVRRFKIGLLVRFLFSCLIDADRTDTADFCRPAASLLRQHGRYEGWPALSGLLERELAGFSVDTEINRLRQHVSESCLSAAGRARGTFTLTVPTGGGKTLASMRFALSHAARWEMDRIIYVSPYTSILDQNAAVVRKILEQGEAEFGSVLLEHHSNLTPEKQTWRSKVLSENWDAPVVFTTAVQVLEALFGSGTRPVRRLHQMANSVLIFDEIQTLPVRCVHLFNNAMNFLVEQCGASVVLCTATQPLLHKVSKDKGAMRLSNNAEIVPDLQTLFRKVQRTEVLYRRKPGGWEHSATAELAAAEVQRTGSCLVIVNTKSEALSIFKACRAGADGATVFHLSTAMCAAHRVNVLEEVRQRLSAGLPVICVSTQLIEAGVDISFGSAIRALAGLDSIAQAAGRCNRNGSDQLGRVYVVNLAGELPKALGDIREAQEAAQRVLDEKAKPGEVLSIDLSDPSWIELYFQYYFFARKNDMDYPVGPERAERAERDDTLLRMLSGNELAANRSRPPVFMKQAFMTAAKAFQAIDAGTQGVIVPYAPEGKDVMAALCAAHGPEERYGLLRLAQRYSVNVFPHVLERLHRAQAVHEIGAGTGILCLEDKYYSSEFGLNAEGTEEMEFTHV